MWRWATRRSSALSGSQSRVRGTLAPVAQWMTNRSRHTHWSSSHNRYHHSRCRRPHNYRNRHNHHRIRTSSCHMTSTTTSTTSSHNHSHSRYLWRRRWYRSSCSDGQDMCPSQFANSVTPAPTAFYLAFERRRHLESKGCSLPMHRWRRRKSPSKSGHRRCPHTSQHPRPRSTTWRGLIQCSHTPGGCPCACQWPGAGARETPGRALHVLAPCLRYGPNSELGCANVAWLVLGVHQSGGRQSRGGRC
mmetsp:Transcript_26371/g.54301  ORF Transcript_26371/g.54301 Transcript_26371/m.54301 type:complete len:247 (-) Transcript_26371:114-854(-)